MPHLDRYAEVLGNDPSSCDQPDELQAEAARSLSDRFARAIQIAEELFPGDVEIEECQDPEDPDLRYVVVTVRATGDLGEIVDRQCEWHNRIERLCDPAMRDLRLSIYPA